MTARAVKLSKTQQALLDDINAGLIVWYMPYMGRFGGGYYWRDDNHKLCTAAARALVQKKLVDVFDSDWRGHKLRRVSP